MADDKIVSVGLVVFMCCIVDDVLFLVVMGA
jgi:hypothetical protein